MPEGVMLASFLQCGQRSTNNCRITKTINHGIKTNMALFSPARISEIGTPLKKPATNKPLRVFMRIVSLDL
jgi:hypothetical protein